MKFCQFLKRETRRQNEFLLIFVLTGIEEEGLLLEDIVQTPAIENPLPEEPPAEPPSAELPEDFTLPEPPVEPEAPGSGTGDLGDVLEPTKASAEEEMPLEESVSEVGLVTEHAHTDADAISEDETKDVEELGEELNAVDTVTLEEKNPAEVDVNEAEIPDELEISTITTETTEESLHTLVPPPEAVDVVSEASEPDAAKIGCLPLDEGSVEGTAEDSNFPHVLPVDEEVNFEQPEEDAPTDVVLASREPSGIGDESVFEEGGVEEATAADTKGPEVRDDPEAPEAPAEAKEATEAPMISTDELTEDEILPVNKEEPEPPVNPAQPTTLSPERVLTFTYIYEINPASEGQPDIIIPSLIEVK